jgi:tetratricopeptide (TPR) repeat protein
MRTWILFLTLVVFVEGAVGGSRPGPDWFEADKTAATLLVTERRDIVDLVGEVSASRPETPQEAMVKLSVLMRAGMNEKAVETIEELGELCPELGNYQISSIYYRACDQYEAWELVRRLLEVFAEQVENVWLENRFLKHWQEAGGSFDEIDGWLAEMPLGRKGYWTKERMRFNEAHGRGDKLVGELTEKVMKNPQNIQGVLVLLDALIHAGGRRGHEWDLSWIAAAIKPKSATEAEKIASRLKTLEQWEAGSTFFRRAIATPLTEREVRDCADRFQVMMSPEILRAIFAVNAREGLAQCLMKMEENDEAQKWMVEAADIREEHKLNMNALFAGEVQAESGARVIESRIKEQEKFSEDDPEYWRKRAEYYRGRREPDNEEQALLKALALAEPKTRPDRPGKGYTDLRSWILRDYVGFLERMKRVDEAIVLLRKELTAAPAESESSKRAARILAFDFEKHVSADDELLWKWLSEQPKWEHTEERLLWRMLEKAEGAHLDKHFSRAEKLTEEQDPTRAFSLGWIMNRMDNPKRSIPLLQYALEHAENKEIKDNAAITLFESYLDIGDWSRAEQIFPDAKRRLSLAEETDWYTRIAVKAAAAGDKDDAMRIWRVAANANPARPLHIRQLAKYGLKDDLAAFYRELAKKLPESNAPDRVFKILNDQK